MIAARPSALAVGLGALLLSSCEMADPKVCAAVPPGEKATLEAFMKAKEDPRVIAARKADTTPPGGLSFAGVSEQIQAQDEVIDACFQRAAYRLAKSEAPAEEVIGAVANACASIARAVVSDPVSMGGRSPEQQALFWHATIGRRVLEARAGKCWRAL